MQKKHFPILLLVLIVGSLLFSNPNESRYLANIHNYYTSQYFESNLTTETIKSIGEHERVTYLLFSTYTYQLGKRKAYYFGIANNVFFLGSKRHSKPKEEIKFV